MIVTSAKLAGLRAANVYDLAMIVGDLSGTTRPES